jgi:hypothetical protein
MGRLVVMTKFKLLAILCTLIAVGGAIFVVVSVLSTRQQARMVLGELRQLNVSSRPNDTFDSFQWEFGRGKFKHSDQCTFHFCTYELDISNIRIARLHLVPYTEMKVWFSVDKGQLVGALVEYRTALKGPNSPVVHVQQGICSHGCGVRFDVNPHGKGKQAWNGLVEFSPRASEAEREAAIALDLDCFHRVGGCKDIADLLPTMWVRNEPDSVTSRLVGLSQRLEESHTFPSADDF